MDIDKFFLEEESEESTNFDFQRYIRGVYKRKWLVLSIFLIVLLPWLFYVKKQPPTYEAYSLIRFKNFDADRLQSLKDGWYTELSSRSFAERVVSQLGLTLELIPEENSKRLLRTDVFSNFYTSKNPKSGIYLLKFGDNQYKLFYQIAKGKLELISQGPLSELVDEEKTINGMSFQIRPDLPKHKKEIKFAIHNFNSSVKNFRQRIKVNFNRSGSLMRLSITDKNSDLVAPMVNGLARLFINESVSSGKQRQQNYTALLEKRLQVAKENLRKANEEIKNFKEAHIIDLNKEIDSKVTNMANMESSVQNLKNTEEKINILLNKLGPGRDLEDNERAYIIREIANLTIFDNDPSMGILRQQLVDLEKRRGTLAKQFTETHPKVIEIDKQIRQTQKKIQDLAEKKLNNIHKNIQSIQKKQSVLKNTLKSLPTAQLRLAELSQKVQVANTIYSELLAKYQEAQISESVESGSVDILDPAIPPEFPINRDKKKKAVMGGFLAIFLSLGTAVTLEFMDKTIKTPEDVKKYLKLSVIGAIPNVKFDEENELNDADKIKKIDSQLVTYDYSPTPIGEAYRALRTKIIFSKNTGKIKTLVVTSFAPGDGKSFTCSNLAITLAQHKTNVLLVDADLRRGVLHNTFSVSKEPGLSNYLMGVASFGEVAQETHVPNLYMVSCGSMVPNPSELLGSMRLKRFIDEAKRRFDFIMFDTPPLNAATDAVVLGTQVDGLLVIVRAEVTNRNVAKKKLELFENVPVNIIGAVLNGSEQDLAHEGYSYYHY